MPKRIQLDISDNDDEVAYLKLPSHPGTTPGIVKQSVKLRDLLKDYKGPDINLDFDDSGTLIGIEIVG